MQQDANEVKWQLAEVICPHLDHPVSVVAAKGIPYFPDANRRTGLYDFPELVNGLGASHERLRDDYEMLLSNAFGADKGKWPAASPARFDPAEIAERVRESKAPQLVILDQSTKDQLVSMSQRERFEAILGKVSGRDEGARGSMRHRGSKTS
jgi:hypothetical protein